MTAPGPTTLDVDRQGRHGSDWRSPRDGTREGTGRLGLAGEERPGVGGRGVAGPGLAWQARLG